MKYIITCFLLGLSILSVYAQEKTDTIPRTDKASLVSTQTHTQSSVQTRHALSQTPILLQNIEGDSININSFIDNKKLTLIKIFSAWEAKYCHTCDHNLDFAATLHDQWTKEEKAAEALFISIDNQATTQDYTSKKTKWQVPILLDRSKLVLQSLDIEEDSAELIFDTEGQLIYSSTNSKLNFYEFLQQYWGEEK